MGKHNPYELELVSIRLVRDATEPMITVLVLSGVSDIDTPKTYAYQPTVILEGVGCITKE